MCVRICVCVHEGIFGGILRECRTFVTGKICELTANCSGKEKERCKSRAKTVGNAKQKRLKIKAD